MWNCAQIKAAGYGLVGERNKEKCGVIEKKHISIRLKEKYFTFITEFIFNYGN